MKRIVCVLLACALLIVPAVRPARAAGTGATIGVIGGAIGTGGAAGGIAAGSVLLPVLGVVGAVLAAYGINVALTDASQEAGLTKTQFIYSKIGEFADFAGLNTDALIQGISTGIKVGSSGNIILDAAGGAVVSQFIDWLFSTGSVVESAGTGSDTVTVGDLELLSTATVGVSSQGEFGEAYFSCDNSSLYFFALNASNGNYQLCVVGPSDAVRTGTLTLTYKHDSYVGSYPFTCSVRGNSCYYSFGVSYHTPGNIAVSQFSTSQQIANYLSSTTLDWGSTGIVAPSDDVFTGTDTLWDENKDLLSPGADDTISIDPDLLNPVIAQAAAGDYTATVPDYLTALAHALDRADAAEVALPVTNVATGAAVPLSVPDTAVASPAITNVAATSPDVVGAGALADPAIPISPGDAVPALQFDLTEIFPFCIPFDLVDMITLLRADPVTPRFHMAWTFPIVNAPVEFDVDLSQFDDIAAMVRPFELLLFVIGLALVTRDLIRG